MWHSHFRDPSKRAGKYSKVRSNANTAPIVTPISRNGRDKSQTTGKRIKASSATGQHSTNKIHQPTKRIIALIHFNNTRPGQKVSRVHLTTAGAPSQRLPNAIVALMSPSEGGCSFQRCDRRKKIRAMIRTPNTAKLIFTQLFGYLPAIAAV